MYIDVDKLSGLSDQNTLRDCLVVNKVFMIPTMAQRIYNSLPAALHLKLTELAKVSSEQILAQPHVGTKVLAALNELLSHFALHITCPPFTLTPSQVEKVTLIATDDEEPFRDSYNRGYLDGMADAFDSTVAQVVAVAKAQTKVRDLFDNEADEAPSGIIDWKGLPDPPPMPDGIHESDLIDRGKKDDDPN